MKETETTLQVWLGQKGDAIALISGLLLPLSLLLSYSSPYRCSSRYSSRSRYCHRHCYHHHYCSCLRNLCHSYRYRFHYINRYCSRYRFLPRSHYYSCGSRVLGPNESKGHLLSLRPSSFTWRHHWPRSRASRHAKRRHPRC